MNKEKIYTIPVTDAFNEDCECPICFIREKLENDAINYVGTACMEVDFRKETNDLGFCKEHYKKLYQNGNALGLALVIHTRMLRLQENIGKLETPNPIKKNGIAFQKTSQKTKLSSYIHSNIESCYICDQIARGFDIYIDTVFYLWKNEPSFRELFKSSKGFCINHYALLYETAIDKLKSKERKEFLENLIRVQNENYKRVLEDLQWFMNKYDYRYEKEPWKNAKDAPKRALKKISSLYLK